jgi:hypothetical protein
MESVNSLIDEHFAGFTKIGQRQCPAFVGLYESVLPDPAYLLQTRVQRS